MSLERLQELLVLRSLEGLSGAEAVELDDLRRAFPEQDEGAIDAVVARLDCAVTSADLTVDHSLPAGLADRVVQRVQALVEADVVVLDPATRQPAAVSAGWWAAAAAVVVAVSLWWGSPGPGDAGAGIVADVQEQVDGDPAATTWSWNPADPVLAAGATGEVRWSQALNTGYMRFVELPANDPAEAQYQLWIFDKTRDERHPVDGGVFDVNADGEVIVPMLPRVPIRQPTLFAVTKERPGGVVVSDRKRLVVVAQVP